MAKHDVATHADGLGRFHATVKNRRPDLRFATGFNASLEMTSELKKYRVAARNAIKRELAERGESPDYALTLEVCESHEDYANGVGYPLTFCFRESFSE